MNEAEFRDWQLLCLYQGILAMSGELGAASNGANLVYRERSQEYYEELRKQYPVVEVAGIGDTQNRAINLLKWVYDNNYHKNAKLMDQECNAVNVFAKFYGAGREGGLNCACLATALTDCLQAAGIAARTIGCHSCNPYDFDMHVISIAYIPERTQWIMLDPTFNAYIMNENGEVVAPWEFRRLLSMRAVVKCSPHTAYHNEDSVTLENRAKEYFRYMAKNSGFYSEWAGTMFDYRYENQRTYLLPEGFDVIDYGRRNVRFSMDWFGEDADQIKNIFGAEDYLIKWRSYLDNQTKANCASFEEFTKAPV